MPEGIVTPKVDRAPAYRYRDRDLNILHTTSVPKDDENALEYFAFVQRWFKDTEVRYIEKRPVGETTYNFLKYEYQDGKAVPM